MKNLILAIKGTDTQTIKAAFFVIVGIGAILFTVQVLYWFHLIKAYSWQ